MKLVLLILTSIFCVFHSYSQDFLIASKKIEKKCHEYHKKNRQSFHKIRSLFYGQGKLDFLNPVFDTLYILEHFDIETGDYNSRIWNSKGALTYIFNKSEIKFLSEGLYTKFTIELIEKWDIPVIRNEEKINANLIPQIHIRGLRIVMKKKKIHIDCVKFKEVFNLERDR